MCCHVCDCAFFFSQLLFAVAVLQQVYITQPKDFVITVQSQLFYRLSHGTLSSFTLLIDIIIVIVVILFKPKSCEVKGSLYMPLYKATLQLSQSVFISISVPCAGVGMGIENQWLPVARFLGIVCLLA